MNVRVTALPGALGATVTGLDVDRLDRAAVDQLRAAWFENLVLFFPGIELNDEQHIRLGEVFGDLAATTQGTDDYRDQDTRGPHNEILVLDGEKTRANAWHTDVTFTAEPPLGSLLSMQVCPDKGGDTLWSNQYLAYETLHPGLRNLIDGLDAVHGRPGMTGTHSHPMVKTHDETGRRALFVNRGWTTRIAGMSPIESTHLLGLLHDHSEKPEFTVRWHWSQGDAALWDNRCTQHYAVNDYGDAARVLHRVTIYR